MNLQFSYVDIEVLAKLSIMAGTAVNRRDERRNYKGNSIRATLSTASSTFLVPQAAPRNSALHTVAPLAAPGSLISFAPMAVSQSTSCSLALWVFFPVAIVADHRKESPPALLPAFTSQFAIFETVGGFGSDLNVVHIA